MMKSTSLFRLTALAGLLLTAGAANAATPLTFTQSVTTPTVWTATFSNPSVSGSFSDIFSFTNPVTPQTLTAGGSANAINLSIGGANVVFNLFSLVDATTSTVLSTGTIAAGGLSAVLNFVLPNYADTYNLQVGGYTSPTASTGSYAGNVAVSAVPEPKTYAMLLAGLGLLAFTARRRKTNSFFAY